MKCANVISCRRSRYLIPALAVQILCSRSSTPFPFPHSKKKKKKNPNQTGMSETTKRDTFFQQVPPVHLASSDHIVCVLSSPLWNSHVSASSASPMKFIAPTAGLQPHSQKTRPGHKFCSFRRNTGFVGAPVCERVHLDSLSTILSTQES